MEKTKPMKAFMGAGFFVAQRAKSLGKENTAGGVDKKDTIKEAPCGHQQKVKKRYCTCNHLQPCYRWTKTKHRIQP